MTYKPDKWVILKITSPDKEVVFKVLGSWYGGFTQGNSWRLNSGIELVDNQGDKILFHGSSGSIYECRLSNYGHHAYAWDIYMKWVEQFSKVKNARIEMLSEPDALSLDWWNYR